MKHPHESQNRYMIPIAINFKCRISQESKKTGVTNKKKIGRPKNPVGTKPGN